MRNTFSGSDHTFIVCAFEESEFLEQCIESLLGQSTKSSIIISTSTPNAHIRGIADKYKLELRVRDEGHGEGRGGAHGEGHGTDHGEGHGADHGGARNIHSGIGADWSFAYKQAATRLKTLAHQDDIYLPEYLSTALEMINKAEKPIIFFSHYAKLVGREPQNEPQNKPQSEPENEPQNERENERQCEPQNERENERQCEPQNREATQWELIYRDKRLRVVKMMLKPLKMFKKSRFIRRRVLSLGCPICCPSVMYIDLENLEFNNRLKYCLDWDKWEELSKLKGSFVCSEKQLIHHRLYGAGASAQGIEEGGRYEEDLYMFSRFWCKPLAKLLTRLYSRSR